MFCSNTVVFLQKDKPPPFKVLFILKLTVTGTIKSVVVLYHPNLSVSKSYSTYIALFFSTLKFGNTKDLFAEPIVLVVAEVKSSNSPMLKLLVPPEICAPVSWYFNLALIATIGVNPASSLVFSIVQASLAV